MHRSFVVIGKGLIGIQVIEKLFSSGVSPNEIIVVDPYEPGMNSQRVEGNSRKIEEIFQRNFVNNGLGKKELSIADLKYLTKSQTYYWGASCLPPMRFEIPRSGHEPESIKAAFATVTKSIGVQGTYSSKSENLNFPFTEEIMNHLPRKQAANNWVNSSDGEIYHSRLAINSSTRNGCTFHGICFEGCPNNSIWNPSNHATNFQSEFTKIHQIVSQASGVNRTKRVVTTLDGHELYYDNLIITAGAQASKGIVSSIYPKMNLQLKSSPVILLPFLVKGGVTKEEFKSHFVLADLLIPFMSENGLSSITQIYLPTTEIAGRVLLQAPKFISELLLLLPERSLEYLMQHVGIAMLFAPGCEPFVPKSKIKEIMREPIDSLRSVLAKNDVELLDYPRRYILDNNSYHAGSIFDADDGSFNAGINSRVYANLISDGIRLLDACLLPSIPPGPHTLTAASLAIAELDSIEE